MKLQIIQLALLLSFCACAPVQAASGSDSSPASGSTTPKEAIELNNKATYEITQGKYAEAIAKLIEALKLDHEYGYAKTNLGIAHNNFAIKLSNKGDQKGALKQLHQAAFVSTAKDNEIHAQNMNSTIQRLGMDPQKFSDRVKLGDNALQEGDLTSAIIEYRAALKLKSDSPTKAKLDSTLSRLKKENSLMSQLDSEK